MPLLETLMVDVGGSIAKALLTRWLSNNTIVSDAASSVADVLKGSLTDRLAQQRARQQFETIGEKVGESLLPLFAVEGASLDESSRTAIALAVSKTLNAASSALLAKHNLEPVEIARRLLIDHPAHSYHFSDIEGRLYEQIVGESCQYIVDIASQLPHFTERTLAEVLTRERHLVEIAERIVQEIARLRAQLNPQVDAARFELDYRRTVKRKLDELELFGSGMSVTTRKYSLSLAYVALSLEYEVLKQPQKHEERRDPLFEEDPNRKPKVIRMVTGFSEALAESTYLLLRGDAGSGKTTLMQWIAVQSADQCFPQELASWNGTVPFLIRLRQHVHMNVNEKGEPSWPTPESFPGLVAPIIAGTMPPGWVHQQLQEGRAIVLVDGIDEVPVPLRESVYAWLGDLIATYPLSRFIVTARPYAASKDNLPAREHLKEAQVLPMSPSAIEEFITQWHSAVAANLQDMQEQQDLKIAASYLIAEIRSSRALQQLATNPLLCAMLCALNRERHQQLPSNRVALYEACCELLIERRDQARRISLADYPAAVLSYGQKSLLLSDLAYWLVRNGQTEVPINAVDERLARHLGRMVGVPSELQGSDARLLFMERSGILSEPIKGAIDFTHRTFQEFLAAKAIVDEDDIPALVAHAHDDQWREVVLLTVGLASRAVRENLVELLLKRGETRKRIRSRLYPLAAACTQSVHEEMRVDIQLRIEQDLATLLPLKNSKEVEAMAIAGEHAIPYLAPRFEYNPQIAAACVRALLHIGSEKALTTLHAYVTDNTTEVIEAFVLGLRDAINKKSYAQRFLSHVNNLVPSPAMFELLHFLPHLSTLSLHRLPSWTDFSFLERLPALSSLTLFDLPWGTDLSFLEPLLALSSLSLHYIPSGTDFSFLERLPALSSLTLHRLPRGTDLSFLERLPALSSLTLYRLPQGTDLSFLERLPALSTLALFDLPQVSDLSFLERLPALSTLSLHRLPQGTDLSFLERLPALSTFTLFDPPRGTDLSFLERLPALSTFTLFDPPRGTDLSFLERLPALSSLTLYRLPQGTDLSFLERLPALSSLTLHRLPQGTDLSFLERLPALSTLALFELPQVSDLSFLERLPALSTLSLYHLPRVSNLSVLERLNELKSIMIGRLAQGCVFPQNVLKRVHITRI